MLQEIMMKENCEKFCTPFMCTVFDIKFGARHSATDKCIKFAYLMFVLINKSNIYIRCLMFLNKIGCTRTFSHFTDVNKKALLMQMGTCNSRGACLNAQ